MLFLRQWLVQLLSVLGEMCFTANSIKISLSKHGLSILICKVVALYKEKSTLFVHILHLHVFVYTYPK